MQKSIHDILQMIETPLISFTVVVLSCVCFLLSLWVIMILVRLVVGGARNGIFRAPGGGVRHRYVAALHMV